LRSDERQTRNASVVAARMAAKNQSFGGEMILRTWRVEICALLAVAFCIVATSRDSFGEEPAAKKSNLKVLTWNIQMLPTFGFLSQDLQKGQALRAPWIIEYLNQQDYDIIALEEVEISAHRGSAVQVWHLGHQRRHLDR
jgi:hypothetical protein